MSLRSVVCCLGLLAVAGWVRADPRPSTVVGEKLKIHHFTSTTFGDAQTLRVWLPPGYWDDPDRTFSVLYLMDGQNLFDRSTSTSGMEWEVDETLLRLIAASAVEPVIVVGIDAPGERRAQEYTPYPDPKHPEAIAQGQRFPDFLVNEVMPFIAKTYHVKTGRSHTAIGGSSLGAVAAFYALKTRPDVFGLGLLESTSLHVGDGQILRDAATLPEAPLRVYVAFGDDELGTPGLRQAEETDAQVQAKDNAFVKSQRDFAAALKSLTPKPPLVKVSVLPGAHHQEIYWAELFPDGVKFIFPPLPRD